jgi:hypothetical protein
VGITALVMPVARVGDEFFKLSQKTGVSVEALTAWTTPPSSRMSAPKA